MQHSSIVVTQMNIQEIFQKFGKTGSEAMLKELGQLHTKDALLPIRKEDIPYKYQKRELKLFDVP